MNLIYGEVLQGTIDGTNRVFTTQNTISSVVNMWLGGATITSFTISGRLVTFNSAIPLGVELPIIDYYYSDNIQTIDNLTYTVQNALNGTLNHLRVNSFNNSFKQSDAIDLLNECYYSEMNKIRKSDLYGAYSFTKGNSYRYGTFYRGDIIPVQVLIDNYTPRVGKIMINGFITDFITRTNNSFTLINGLTFTPQNNDIILVGYYIPQAVKELTNITVDGELYTRKTIDQFGIGNLYGTYCVKNDYLFFSLGGQGQVICNYSSKNKIFSLVTDIIEIDFVYKDILPLYASYNMLLDSEDTRATILKSKYIELKRKYIAYLLRHSKNATTMNTFNGPMAGL